MSHIKMKKMSLPHFCLAVLSWGNYLHKLLISLSISIITFWLVTESIISYVYTTSISDQISNLIFDVINSLTHDIPRFIPIARIPMTVTTLINYYRILWNKMTGFRNLLYLIVQSQSIDLQTFQYCIWCGTT